MDMTRQVLQTSIVDPTTAGSNSSAAPGGWGAQGVVLITEYIA